jgi:uncharacterized coiled-coil protein SlyX
MSDHWSDTHRPHYVDGDSHNMQLVPKASWNSSMEKDNRIADLERQLKAEEKLSHLLAQALAEIKATVDGDSSQQVKSIIYGCIEEVRQLNLIKDK